MASFAAPEHEKVCDAMTGPLSPSPLTQAGEGDSEAPSAHFQVNEGCRTTMSRAMGFRPAWWLRNPHLQTLWPYLLRRAACTGLYRERLELPDGDYVDLDWARRDGPVLVLILHGLEGSSRSPYAAGLLRALSRCGCQAVLMHFRGCSGEVNRLPRSYHSGDTGDVAYVVDALRARQPRTPIAVVGFSLGGNVLLKWLGETGVNAPLAAAVAVSVPFDLAKAALRLNQGFSRLYQWKLLRSLKRKTALKFSRMAAPVKLGPLSALSSFRRFDDRVTAPLHGFRDADHYYAEASSRRYLSDIRAPTLVIHALDDPFMTPDTPPRPGEIPQAVTLELSRHGGHVGFVSGPPWRPRYWHEQRICDFLTEHLLATSAPANGASAVQGRDATSGDNPPVTETDARAIACLMHKNGSGTRFVLGSGHRPREASEQANGHERPGQEPGAATLHTDHP